MANLQGGTFDKQVRNAFHRLEAFGTSRHNGSDHLSHSVAIADKRDMMMKDFAKFAENDGLSGKLNDHMTNENIEKFLTERTADLAFSTSENYTRGFSSMVDGLREANISIPVEKEVFDNVVKDLKENQVEQHIENRYIENVKDVIDDIYLRGQGSGLVAEIQAETGLRVGEALKLANDPERYLKDGQIKEMIGKGNHMYHDKDISAQLEEKLLNNDEKIPSYQTYQNHLPDNMTSHDFRFTYAKDAFDERMAAGMEYNQALLEVSHELNHTRAEITEHYLART